VCWLLYTYLFIQDGPFVDFPNHTKTNSTGPGAFPLNWKVKSENSPKDQRAQVVALLLLGTFYGCSTYTYKFKRSGERRIVIEIEIRPLSVM
jgi:hypothetical protein